MRAIDADAMIDRLKEWDTKDKTDKALYNFTLNRINEQPTIQPKRGTWIDRGERGDWEWQADGRGKHWHEWECNICHHYFAERSFFCPHCGSDMRGDKYA